MIKVYDQSMRLAAILQKAFDISYEERTNELWTASFSLPADDPKLVECKPLRFVEIFDGDERVDLFRIIPMKTQRSSDGKTVYFECEHVLATLIDDVLFQYHQVGGSGMLTRDVLQYIISKQMTPRWQLGTVSFSRQFEYKFENDNLLGGLFAVPKPFEETYLWTWDTSTMPWKLNLIQPSVVPAAYIRYGKNLIGITKVEDPSLLCTRLYALGYGEGVNQLDITSVNPTGLPYIDADTQSQYGVISRIWTDRRYEYADTLFAAAKAQLEQLKLPKLTYTVDGAELYRLTNDPLDKFKAGTIVRVIDGELAIDIEARVLIRTRSDINGSPGGVRLQIANKQDDLAGNVADLDARQRINEVTAQGATNIDSNNFADNADPDHPAVLKFYLPDETVRVNKLTLSYECQPFRAYSRSNASQETKVITSTVAESVVVSSTPGFWYVDYVSFIPGDIFMDASGEHTHTFSGSDSDTVSISGNTSSAGDPSHNHYFNNSDSVSISISGTTSLSGAHVHNVYPSHDHDVTIPSHKHDVTIPSHTHEIIYGIYEGQTPTSLEIKIDGTEIPITGTNGSDVDLIPYLSKDDGGRVQRGSWHTIEIKPDRMGRIIANVVTQLFVQSRGGGDY
jgi:phage minor structural protein